MSFSSPSPSPSPPPLQGNSPVTAAAGEGATSSSPVPPRRFQYCPEDGHRFAPGEKTCPICETKSDATEYLQHATEGRKPNGVSKPRSHHHTQQQNQQQPQLQSEEKQRWRKLLYTKQDFPDNFVDHTFLEAMERNGSPSPHPASTPGGTLISYMYLLV